VDVVAWQAANPIQPVFAPGTKFLSREAQEYDMARQKELDKLAAEQWEKEFGLKLAQFQADQQRTAADSSSSIFAPKTAAERTAYARAQMQSAINEDIASGLSWDDIEKNIRAREPALTMSGIDVNEALLYANNQYSNKPATKVPVTREMITREVKKPEIQRITEAFERIRQQQKLDEARQQILNAIQQDYNLKKYGIPNYSTPTSNSASQDWGQLMEFLGGEQQNEQQAPANVPSWLQPIFGKYWFARG
jgi:hypothetical protein